MKKERGDELRDHFNMFTSDQKESISGNMFFSKLKLNKLYHIFKDPLMHRLIGAELRKRIKNNIPNVDQFLCNEGGLYKFKVYEMCDDIKKIKGSTILVQGCGYGRNLIQLISFKPKEIIAFDLFEYKEEWEWLIKYAKERNVKLEFMCDDMNKISKKYKNYFDFAISDAVLEHIKNLDIFLKRTRMVLKDDGIFYASFGPIWYGPGGDHISWGEERIYDHLLLPKEQYNKNCKTRYNKEKIGSFNMINEELFSYLSIQEYLDSFDRNNFKKIKILTKIHTGAIKFLGRDVGIGKKLDAINAPKFDRYCSGVYLWMKK